MSRWLRVAGLPTACVSSHEPPRRNPMPSSQPRPAQLHNHQREILKRIKPHKVKSSLRALLMIVRIRWPALAGGQGRDGPLGAILGRSTYESHTYSVTQYPVAPTISISSVLANIPSRDRRSLIALSQAALPFRLPSCQKSQTMLARTTYTGRVESVCVLRLLPDGFIPPSTNPHIVALGPQFSTSVLFPR
jgi:hypothetical protein